MDQKILNQHKTDQWEPNSPAVFRLCQQPRLPYSLLLFSHLRRQICRLLKATLKGVPWWLSGLRTWRCQCCGSGHCHSVGSVPGLGTTECCGCCHRQVNKSKLHVCGLLKLISGSHSKTEMSEGVQMELPPAACSVLFRRERSPDAGVKPTGWTGCFQQIYIRAAQGATGSWENSV